MSAIGTALGRAVASLGGPQVAAVIVAGGVIAGSLGGAVLGSGGSGGQPATTGGSLALYPCPDQGPALTTVTGGQKLLVTGRTADGAWLRIHYPLPGRTEAWVQASPLSVNGSPDTLPVATCEPELAAGAPDVAPGPSLTAILNLPPSPAPTPEPTPTPSPTVAPTASPTAAPNAKPSLSGLTVSTRTISYDQGAYCPTAVKKVTFRVKASDTAGVDGVTLFWREPGATAYARSAMNRVAGSARSGTWQVTLDTTANGITKAGKLAFYAVATDTAGATARIPASGANTITVAVCVNRGPAITGAASSAGSSLFWDPLGVGCTPTTTNITATVKDVDGVASVTLFYRPPGSATWLSKPMDNQTIPGKWYANLDTLGDKISIVSPPTDTLSWYIKAVDGTGLASQTKAASITIRRCDAEATFFVNAVGTSYTFCPPKTTSVTLAWSFSITDPDGLVSATLSYRLVNSASGQSYSQTVTVPVTSQRFSITSAAIDGTTFSGSNSVVWTITTTDLYGGKSPSESKNVVRISVC